MYTYHKLIKRMKGQVGVLAIIGEIFAFLIPIVWSCFFDAETMKLGPYYVEFWIAILLAIIYIVYLSYRIFSIYKINSDRRDAYRKQYMEQVDSVIVGKYKMLCREIHYSTHQENDVLLYEAHDVLRDCLAHIKQLIANITDADLNNISVNLVYKYQGENEYWQTADGSSSCSIGKLDDIVEKQESMYHYLYANNREYVFVNDKAGADWHMYKPSIRDGENKKSWGSIYCKRILCTIHQNRFVDGILAISTYNEKFCDSKRKARIIQTEGLINEAVSVFENVIRSELTALFIRHEYLKKQQIDVIKALMDCGIVGEKIQLDPNKMSEHDRKRFLQKYVPLFKSKYNKEYPTYFTLSAEVDQKLMTALKYSKNVFNKEE